MTTLSFCSTYKKTFELFKWSNLRLFLLVSSKTLLSTLLLSLKYFWWAHLVSLSIILFPEQWDRIINISAHPWPTLIFETLLNSYLGFTVLLCARPSLEKKDAHYFLSYHRKFFGYLCLIALSIFLISMGKNLVDKLNIEYLNTILSVIDDFFRQTVYGIGALFLLDNKTTIKTIALSFFNSMRAAFYFTPFFAALYLILRIVVFKITLVGYFLETLNLPSGVLMAFMIFFLLLSALISLTTISLLVNFYIRIKHENYALFFK